jgi:hypothetical protein
METILAVGLGGWFGRLVTATMRSPTPRRTVIGRAVKKVLHAVSQFVPMIDCDVCAQFLANALLWSLYLLHRREIVMTDLTGVLASCAVSFIVDAAHLQWSGGYLKPEQRNEQTDVETSSPADS